MAKSAVLNVSVLVDAAKAASGLNETASKFEAFASKATKLLVGAFAVDKIVDGVKGMVNAASDLEQAIGGTDKVFGANAAQIHTWAADTSDAIRLPQAAFEQLATGIGVQLKAAGIPLDLLTDQVYDLLLASADLASGMGRDLVDVAGAVRGALGGEYDSLQNMGVAISDAVVKAEAFRIAQETGKAATDAAVIAQARYNVIMEGAATFSGQAAAEADSFAGRMDSLKEKLGNAAAEAGGPLLEAFGGLIDRFTEIIPAAGGVMNTLTDIIAAVSMLPTPVLAVTAAIAAMIFLGPGIIGFFAGIGAAITAFTTKVAAMRAAAVVAGTSMSALGAGVRVAGTSMLAAVGGPWGLLLAAGAAVATVGIIKWTEGAADAKRMADDLKSAVNQLQTVLRSGGDIGTAQFDLFAESLENVETGFGTVGDAATAAGVGVEDFIAGISGDGAKAELVLGNLTTKLADLQAQQDRARAESARFSESGIGMNDPALQAQIDGVQKLIDMYRGYVPTVDEAKKAEDERNKIAAETPGVNEEVAQSFDEVRKAAEKYADELLKAYQAQSSGFVTNSRGSMLLKEQKEMMDAAAQSAEILGAVLDKTRVSLDTETAEIGLIKDFRELREMATDEKTGAGVQDILHNFENLSAVNLVGSGTIGSDVADLFSSIRGNSDRAIADIVRAGQASGQSVGEIQFHISEYLQSLQQNLIDTGVAPERAAQIVQQVAGIISGAEIDPLTIDVLMEDFQARKTALYWATVVLDPVTLTFTSILPEAQPIVDALNKDLQRNFPTVPFGAEPPTSEDVRKAQSEAQDEANRMPPAGIATEVKPPVSGGFQAIIDAEKERVGTGIEVPIKPTLSSTIGSGIGGLVTSLFGSDKPEVKVPVSATGVPEAQAQISGIKPTPINVPANTTQASEAIRLIMTAQRTTVPIQVPANIIPANDAIRQVMTAQRTTIPINVPANVVPANDAIRLVMVAQRTTAPINVPANTGPANDAIRLVMVAQRTTSPISVGADTGPAQSSIRAVTNGAYTAVIRVVADTSSFFATFNSLPGSRPVGAAPQLAAPVAFAAPSLKASTGKASTTIAGPSLTINVSGALWPDDSARAVQDVLRRRDRRVGAVRL